MSYLTHTLCLCSSFSALIDRSLQETVPLSEVSGHIPPSCENRVKLLGNEVAPPVDKPCVADGKKPSQPAAATKKSPVVKIPLKATPSPPTSVPYTPLYLEKTKRTREDIGTPSTSSTLPGALVVDPSVRDLVKSEGLRVTENAVWLFIVAIKEYTKSMISKAITSKEARRKNQIPPKQRGSLQLIPRTKGAKGKGADAKKVANPIISPQKEKAEDKLRLAQDKVISVQDLGLLASSMRVSPVDSLGGRHSRLACERCLFAPVDTSRAIRSGGFSVVHNFITSEISTAAAERQKNLKAQRLAKPAASKSSTDGAVGKKDLENSAPPKENGPATTENKTEPLQPVGRTTSRSPIPGQGLGRGSKNLGLGRGAKNLAALMARTTAATPAPGPTGAAGTVPAAASTTSAPPGAPTAAKTNAHSNSVHASPAPAASGTSTSIAAPAPAPEQNRPAGNPNQVVKRGRGLGKKNLAAMRARVAGSGDSKTDDSTETAQSAPPLPAAATNAVQLGLSSSAPAGKSNAAVAISSQPIYSAPAPLGQTISSDVSNPTQPSGNATPVPAVQASAFSTTTHVQPINAAAPTPAGQTMNTTSTTKESQLQPSLLVVAPTNTASVTTANPEAKTEAGAKKDGPSHVEKAGSSVASCSVPSPKTGDTEQSANSVPAPTTGDTEQSANSVPAPTTGDTEQSPNSVPALTTGDTEQSANSVPASAAPKTAEGSSENTNTTPRKAATDPSTYDIAGTTTDPNSSSAHVSKSNSGSEKAEQLTPTETVAGEEKNNASGVPTASSNEKSAEQLNESVAPETNGGETGSQRNPLEAAEIAKDNEAESDNKPGAVAELGTAGANDKKDQLDKSASNTAEACANTSVPATTDTEKRGTIEAANNKKIEAPGSAVADYESGSKKEDDETIADKPGAPATGQAALDDDKTKSNAVKHDEKDEQLAEDKSYSGKVKKEGKPQDQPEESKKDPPTADGGEEGKGDEKQDGAKVE